MDRTAVPFRTINLLDRHSSVTRVPELNSGGTRCPIYYGRRHPGFKQPIPADDLPRLAILKHIGGSYFNVHGFNVCYDFISLLLAWRRMEQLGFARGDVTHEQIARVMRQF